MNILEEIAAKTRERVQEEKKRISLTELRREAEQKQSASPLSFRLTEVLKKTWAAHDL